MARAAIAKSEPSTHALARRAAQRSATHRVIFIGHALAWAAVLTLLLVVASLGATIVVGLSWGIALAAHGFVVFLGPELQQRLTEEELERRLAKGAAEERRSSEERHARSLEELAASIAHEIRNPITAAKSLVQQIGADPSAAENAEYARVACEELDRVERSVSHLLRYAREEELELESILLDDVVTSALDGLGERIRQSRARVERDADFDAPLRGDSEKLRRVVMNLVQNALDALDAEQAEDPVVKVSSGRSLAGNEVWLRVKDNGPGIEPARLAKIWSPFHTSKERGTGLGLAIAKKVVEAHGGSIGVTSASGAGTEFIATFPSQQATK